MADDWNVRPEDNKPPARDQNAPHNQMEPPQQPQHQHQPQPYYEDESSGGGFPSWLIWIGLLILINVLSYVFGWGFMIY